MFDQSKTVLVGVSGTGYIARGLCRALKKHGHLNLAAILSRRALSSVASDSYGRLCTNEIEAFVERSSIIVECSGDPIFASQVVECAFAAGRPVITMNAEFQIVAGSYYQQKGFLSEAEGDQPGSLASLVNEVCSMGFEPVVLGSQKGFFNPNPDPAEMKFWAEKQNIALDKTIAFTDGTKMQIETALIANGLGGRIAQPGLIGPKGGCTRTAALELSKEIDFTGRPVVDYVLNGRGRGEVFVTARHQGAEQDALSYLKMGEGPDYYFERAYHLGFVEIPKSIERALATGMPLLNNGPTPTVSVAAIAKTKISKGQRIKKATGSEGFRGIAVNMIDAPNHVPIGLLQDCEVRRSIEPGEMISVEDVSLPDSLALEAWRWTMAQARRHWSFEAEVPQSTSRVFEKAK